MPLGEGLENLWNYPLHVNCGPKLFHPKSAANVLICKKKNTLKNSLLEFSCSYAYISNNIVNTFVKIVRDPRKQCPNCIRYNTITRAWCKTIVTTSFYIRSYNSFAPSPRKTV